MYDYFPNLFVPIPTKQKETKQFNQYSMFNCQKTKGKAAIYIISPPCLCNYSQFSLSLHENIVS